MCPVPYDFYYHVDWTKKKNTSDDLYRRYFLRVHVWPICACCILSIKE